MDFWDRFRLIIETQRVSINKFEDSIGASRGVIAKMLRLKTDISSKWLVAIKENYPQYSLDWLMVGKGEMLDNHAQTADNKFAMELIEKKDAEIKSLERKIWEQEKEIEELKKASAIFTSTLPGTTYTSPQQRK